MNALIGNVLLMSVPRINTNPIVTRKGGRVVEGAALEKQ